MQTQYVPMKIIRPATGSFSQQKHHNAVFFRPVHLLYSSRGKIAHELAKAKEEMLKAGEKAGQGEPDKTVDHFRKAWEHAQKAIKAAVEEQGE